MSEKRYYYKSLDGKSLFNLKSPDYEGDANYIEISETEFNELTYVAPYEPTEQELAAQEKENQIKSLKAELAATDYVVIKIAESDDPEEIASLRREYADIITHRKEIRATLNQLLEE